MRQVNMRTTNETFELFIYSKVNATKEIVEEVILELRTFMYFETRGSILIPVQENFTI